MVVINFKDIPGVHVPPPNARELRVALDPTVGNYDKATALLSSIEPRSTTGLHKHDSDEIMYVVRGVGESIEVENGVQKVTSISEGCVIYASAGIEHQIRNIADSQLVLFCMFIPGLRASGYLKEAIEESRKHFVATK